MFGEAFKLVTMMNYDSMVLSTISGRQLSFSLGKISTPVGAGNVKERSASQNLRTLGAPP